MGRPPRRSRKPQALKTAVVAKALAGECKAQIGRDLKINRNTVAAILEESQLSILVDEAKSMLYGILPKGVANIDKALSGRKPDTVTAMWLLERAGVVKAEGVSTGVNINFVSHLERPERGSNGNTNNRNLPAIPETAGVSPQCG